MHVFFNILLGCLVSLMIFVNGIMEQTFGRFLALFFINISGVATAFLISRLKSKEKMAVPSKKSFFIYLGPGTCGLFIVLLSNFIFLQAGVLATMAGTLAGQAAAAFTFDARKSQTSWMQLSSTLIIIAGSIFIALQSSLTLPLILISWIPGVLLMVQAKLNVRLSEYTGPAKMALLNFSIPLFVAIGILFINLKTFDYSPILSAHPILFFISGIMGTMTLIGTSFILKRISSMKFVLSLFSGQIFAGIIIDHLLKLPVPLQKYIAMLVLIIGLIFNNLTNKPMPQKVKSNV